MKEIKVIWEEFEEHLKTKEGWNTPVLINLRTAPKKLAQSEKNALLLKELTEESSSYSILNKKTLKRDSQTEGMKLRDAFEQRAKITKDKVGVIKVNLTGLSKYFPNNFPSLWQRLCIYPTEILFISDIDYFTPLHYDENANCMAMIEGEKFFVLISPSDLPPPPPSDKNPFIIIDRSQKDNNNNNHNINNNNNNNNNNNDNNNVNNKVEKNLNEELKRVMRRANGNVIKKSKLAEEFPSLIYGKITGAQSLFIPAHFYHSFITLSSSISIASWTDSSLFFFLHSSFSSSLLPSLSENNNNNNNNIKDEKKKEKRTELKKEEEEGELEEERRGGRVELDNLSDGEVLMIFSYLSAKEVLNVARVNKRFFSIAFDNSLWRSFLSRFSFPYPSSDLSSIEIFPYLNRYFNEEDAKKYLRNDDVGYDENNIVNLNDFAECSFSGKDVFEVIRKQMIRWRLSMLFLKYYPKRMIINNDSSSDSLFPFEYAKYKYYSLAIRDASLRLIISKPARGFNLMKECGIVNITRESINELYHRMPSRSMTDLLLAFKNTSLQIPDLLPLFLENFDFSKLEFIDAYRTFLANFRLPGEAPLIDGIVEKFANRFVESAPRKFSQAFSVLMLNTDHHNPMVKRKMTYGEFIRGHRGIIPSGTEEEKDWNQLLTDCFYDIDREEIVWDKFREKEEEIVPENNSLSSFSSFIYRKLFS